MDEDGHIELNEDFEYEIARCILAWELPRIDRRPVNSGPDGGTIKKVAGFICSPGSMKTFRRVLEELRPEDTVESVFVQERFLPLTTDWPMALAEARRRLETDREE